MTITTTQPPQRLPLSAAEKKAFLEKRLRRKGAEAAKTTTIPRRGSTGPAPLSYTQEGVWYLEQLQPGTATYNIPLAWRLRGPLNIPALEQSLQAIVQRHEALRTGFITIEGQPRQVITPTLNFTLATVDLHHLPPSEREERAAAQVKEEGAKPFNLTQAPLFRARLLCLAPEEFILTLTLHHIIGDGSSFGILSQELAAFYAAFSTGQPAPPLPDLPIQYADFAVWQREQLQGEKLETHLAHWRRQLAGASPVLELPTDYARPALQRYQGARSAAVLTPSLSQALKDLSRQENATLFMTLLTGFKILLQRFTGQADIVVGAPMINRNRVEFENLIGYFLNNLVLRTDLSGDLTFRQLLTRVRTTTLEAYSHQDLPFEKLVQELQPERDLSYTPFFQVFFNMFTAFEHGKLDLAGVTAENLARGELDAGSKFDLTLYVQDKAGQIHFDLVYKTTLFCRERMAELLAQYEQLLTQIVADPDRRLAEFSLVTPTAAAILPDPTEPLSAAWQGAVQTQFSQQARQQPDQIAVVDHRTSWTYRELDRRANQLAHYLRDHGLQTGDVVAIYGHRSAALVWAWLGVLKAGAALVNLDPAYPAERLLHYLQISQPKGLIQLEAAGALPAEVMTYAQTFSCRATLPAHAPAAETGPWAAYPVTPPPVEIGPDDTAYIAFTSGSTGQPKGIYGRHGPLSHFLPWQTEAFKLSPADRFSLLSGLSHDPLQRDIFTPLWVGATICIPEPDRIGTPGYLAQWMAQEHITFAHLTPPMCQILTETAGATGQLPDLRHVFFVGDKLTRQDVNQLRRLAPNVMPINSYGSTETQRAVGYYFVNEDPPPTGERLPKAVYPLGRGMPAAQLLILNQNQQLAGIGEVGEIHLRSPHLARGYVGDETLTQARFISNPFTNLAGDRLYKTGDLGRYRLDGTVEFAGRADRQLKIRGFRLEPGEIETALAQHPAVQEAVVIPVEPEGRAGQQYLAAYVTPAGQSELDMGELKRYLSARLPAFMVPAALVRLETIPLTPNGKINYKALPKPEANHWERPAETVAPRTPEEQAMAALWAEVLGVEQVGVTDNFFGLGGHSLLAVRLLARLEQTTGHKLPLTMLFQAPTVEQLTRLIHHQEQATTGLRSLVPLRAGGANPPIFCLPGNLGNVFTDLGHLARHLTTDQPFYGLQDNADNPAKIEALAAHYLEEIRTVQAEGPYFIAGICSGGVVAYEMARQLQAQGQTVALLALIEPSIPHVPGLRTYAKFVAAMTRRFFRRFQYHSSNFSRLGAAEQKDFTRLKRKLLANIWAMRRYVVKPYPGRLHLFLTEDSLKRTNNKQLDWRQHALGGVELHQIPGDHDTITGTGEAKIEEAYIKVLAGKLKARLEEILRQ